jgi:dihydroxy-acid dehydratase
LHDLDEAGGIAAVMYELQPLLNLNVMTVTGITMGDNLKAVPQGDHNIIRPLETPLAKEGGLVFLKGNLAPNGALVKKAAVPVSMLHHQGPASIYSDEASACDALIGDQIPKGAVVVVRYVGPKGDPGMRLLQRFLWLLAAKGMQDKIAFITDGRFSGTNRGCAVGHIGPEAAEGGPLAVVKEGDMIDIDIRNETIRLLVSDQELEERMQHWVAPQTKANRGYLRIYERLAKSADKGAALSYAKI